MGYNYIYDKLWYEMCQAKFMARYFSLLIAKRRIIYKILQIASIVIATLGVILFRYDYNFSYIALSIVTLILVTSYILPAFIPSPEMILKIENTVTFYSKKFVELEKLWRQWRKCEISEKDLSDSVYEIMEQNIPHETAIDSFLTCNDEKIWNKSKEFTDTYFKNVYKTE